MREEGGERIVQYVSYGFRRDDWIFDPRVGMSAYPVTSSLQNHKLCKVVVFSCEHGISRHIPSHVLLSTNKDNWSFYVSQF